ncbi:hypothetical protein [Rhodopila sp.]|uniref:hypothetical protein n=1 Tax=Rhodopila sp. TaxID=2480087 RepID=UPI003D13C78A
MTPATNHPTTPTDRADHLLGVVLAMLTPLLTVGGVQDARLAALQAIAACQTGGQGNLVSISQIVGFAIASLDNLRLSAPPELSLSMKLKLRGNANALSRTSLNVSAAGAHPPPLAAADLPERPPPPAAEPDRDDADHHSSAIAELRKVRDQLRQARAADPAGEPLTPRQRDLAWASAMTEVAAEYSTGLADLPAAQQRIELTRINALTRTAGALTRGNPSLKTRLLSATSLQSPPPPAASPPAASPPAASPQRQSFSAAASSGPSHQRPTTHSSSPQIPLPKNPPPQSPPLQNPSPQIPPLLNPPLESQSPQSPPPQRPSQQHPPPQPPSSPATLPSPAA